MNVNKNQSGTPIVIGIDHGYGNIKTASSCFRTSVKAYDTEPTFTSNMLVYNGRYYIIGEGHKEFIPEKQNDDDYYILTLAAVGRELYARNLESASVFLAAGLPLTWVGEQKDEFKAYLLRESHVDFVYKRQEFHVDFVGAEIFPQGFAAVAGQLGTFRGVNMICDIGNGTMNVMFITDCRPQSANMFTEKFGTNQCMLNIREQLMRKFGSIPDDAIIENVLRSATAFSAASCSCFAFSAASFAWIWADSWARKSNASCMEFFFRGAEGSADFPIFKTLDLNVNGGIGSLGLAGFDVCCCFGSGGFLPFPISASHAIVASHWLNGFRGFSSACRCFSLARASSFAKAIARS